MEERLRDAALAKGLTAEGYLLTLIEAIVQPKAVSRKTAYARVAFLFKRGRDLQDEETANPDQVVRESIRQMRESVLKYKEQAVDAVTTMNMLRSAVDRQERQSVEKERHALSALAEQERDRAKRLWQEHTILERHLEAVRQELASATEAATTCTRAFRQEEQRVKDRVSKAQAGALKAYEAVMLPSSRMTPLIEALQTETGWDQAFEEWVLQTEQRLSHSTLETDLPEQVPVDDAEAFTQKALSWAKEARRIPPTIDSGGDPTGSD